MAYKGRIVTISICVVFGLIQYLYFHEDLSRELLDQVIALILAWFLGRQFDKEQYYRKQLQEKERENQELMETLVAESKQRYQSLFTHNTECVLEFDLNGNLIQGNSFVEKICGYTVEDLKIIGAASIVAPECMEKKLRHTMLAVGGEPQEYELTIFHKKGHQVEINVKMVPIFIGERLVGIFEIIRDLTESKKMETFIRQADKLSVVGQLAAGIAHEIRNPLTTIKGFIQLLDSNLNQRHSQILLSEIDRINLIVSEFLILSKPHEVDLKPHHLNSIVRSVITFLEPLTNLRNVQILYSETFDSAVVRCEENQLKQVFINLLKNAVESMPQGGKIHMELNEINPKHISVLIRDEGCGIPQDQVNRLGEPFFTTKEDGTGLGIMVTQQILKNHGGYMGIDSELNKGTTVHVILPSQIA
ncbi:ATP-binding protein [Ammoniphilus sp. YIM 78166]|uniref:ATP-binding protein n=1 Tax=Ammoniphilus sp. YIM 78166 TaxID=1644106 RepID=UPI001070427B|nr:ATP-binding protein [Ammoniphilus sp. YIM 78166]